MGAREGHRTMRPLEMLEGKKMKNEQKSRAAVLNLNMKSAER
jgi:hypothetical protein